MGELITIYPDGDDHIRKVFAVKANALAEARKLRKEGWIVKVQAILGCDDAICWLLEAQRPSKEKREAFVLRREV